MKNLSKLTILIVILMTVTLTGCATSRGIVSLQLPETTITLEFNGKYIYIESVVDKRIFEEHPKNSGYTITRFWWC